MIRIIGIYCFLFLLYTVNIHSVCAQEELTIENFIDIVKSYHPYVKQAQLRLDASEAKLMKARGAFDPQLLYGQSQKQFNGSKYYEKEQTQLIIPTFFGLSLKAQMQQAQGNYLDPENLVSGDQLYSVGASLDLTQGLLTNPRQTSLKQAKLFTKQAYEENILEVNRILETASHAYLDWYKTYRTFMIDRKSVV